MVPYLSIFNQFPIFIIIIHIKHGVGSIIDHHTTIGGMPMTAMIYVANEEENVHSIYLKINNEYHHLFDQKFTKWVKASFSEPLPLFKAISMKNNKNSVVSKTAQKIQRYALKLSKELGIEIFESRDKKLYKLACAYYKYNAGATEYICA